MRRFFVVFALAGCLLSGCAAVPPDALSPAGGARGSQMSAGGSTLAGGPRRSVPVPEASSRPVDLATITHYRHPRAEAMLRSIMEQLLAVAGSLPVSPDVAILDSASYNAVLQNNRLYVTRGMLALMNDRSEMAAILAHEIGHVQARHARRRIAARNQALASTIDIAQTFRDPELTRQAIDIQKRSLAAFSREQEHEADLFGNALMAKAGFDPSGAVRSLVIHERMKGLFGRIAGLRTRRQTSVLATHPPTPERIAKARRQVAGFAKRPSAAGRNSYLAAIDGLRFSNAASTSYIRGRNFIHAERNVAITMPPGFVPVGARSGVLGVGRSGKAFVIFSALKPQYGSDP
jgi:predicted Zn-dependent protease